MQLKTEIVIDERRSMRTGKGTVIGLLTLLLIMVMFSAGSAEDRGKFNLEGSLTGLGLIDNKKVKIIFSLYDSETAVAAFWSQQQIIEISNGKYSALLSSFPNHVFLDDKYYLGIEVRTQQESICLGRKRLATVLDL